MFRSYSKDTRRLLLVEFKEIRLIYIIKQFKGEVFFIEIYCNSELSLYLI